MRKHIYIVIGILLSALMAACSDMNDMHDPFMKEGEITYVGRVDSIQVFSGRERVLIHFWITDPRVKKVWMYWNQKRDSVLVPVPVHAPADVLEIMIGEGDTRIKEGDYTFLFYSHDDRGHRSVKFESLINVYGDRYQSTLNNRSVKKVTQVSDHELKLEWGGSSSINEIGIEVLYTDINGEEISCFIASKELSSPAVFKDIDRAEGMKYRTWYKPNPLAIDQFSAPLTPISIN